MKESEFRARLDKRFEVYSDAPRTKDFMVALAREAGATFEPELAQLGNMSVWNYRGGQRLMFQDGREPNIKDLMEVIRRCKAVEEAVKFLRAAVPDYRVDPAPLLAILEGTK